ncbi:MAG: FAD-dependent oxidoreductase [Thermosediminibacteraceae bacterium]|nr:FAD-dependent oxidoreductase [Thermosediminibacteraceae bacterium]
MYAIDVLEKMKEIVDNCMGDAPAYCVATCPMHTDARGYIKLISEGRYKEAIKLIREKLFLPATLGRICAHPCEQKCKRNEVGHQPMSIAALKRFAAEYDDPSEWDLSMEPENGKKVAIIGSGPAGAQAAIDLRRKGYKVTIFEKLPVAGGMLRVGIPEYRLPRDILEKEYSYLEKLGIEICLNTEVGKDVLFSDIRDNYDAVLIAIGAHKSVMLPVPGIDLEGVIPAVDFLREVSMTRKFPVGERVAVIGGGNVAMDVARSLIRVGAKKVDVFCLEKRDEMPAHPWEVEEAEEEGVVIHNGWGPKEIVGEEGKVKKIVFKACTSVFDMEGRFNPCYDESKLYEIEVDNVVLAVGQTADSSFLADTGIELLKNGKVKADPVTLETSLKGVFAAGDAVGRPLFAIEAMAEGRKAAISIDRYLKGEDLRAGREFEGAYETWLEKDVSNEQFLPRVQTRKLPPKERVKGFMEVDLGFTEEMARKEAQRCLQCECRLCVKECLMLQDFTHCPKELFKEILETGKVNPLIPYSCNMCNKCTLLCPKEFRLADRFSEMRKALVKHGIGPLKEHRPILMHQRFSFSSIFNVTLPDKKAGFTKRIFYPGCSLPSYNPEAVGRIYEYLKEKLPGTGAILKCCGKPTKALGLEELFKERSAMVVEEVRKLGAEEVITACQSCYKMLSEYLPKHLPGVKVRSLWVVLKEIGLPEEVRGIAKNSGMTVAIHDSCVTRDVPEIHDAVRFIVSELGYGIEELPNNRENTRCCGYGGMVVPANPELAKRIMQRRAGEATSEYIATYCAACRASMVMGGKKGLHLLDLIFGGDWRGKETPGIDSTLQSWSKRWKTKKILTRIANEK